MSFNPPIIFNRVARPLLPSMPLLLVTLIFWTGGCQTAPAPRGQSLSPAICPIASLNAVDADLSAGRLQQGRRRADAAVAQYPLDPAVHIESARVAAAGNQLDLAGKELSCAAVLAPRDAQAPLLAAQLAERREQPEQALSLYRKALALLPDDSSIAVAAARVLAQLDRPGEALALLHGSIHGRDEQTAVVDAYGRLLTALGLYSQAAAELRQAVREDPRPVLRERLAMALFVLGQDEACDQTLDELMSHADYARRPDLLILRGRCALRMLRPAEAEEAFARAAQLDERSAAAWTGVGKSALANGETASAADALRRAIALDPTDDVAPMLLGYVRLRQDRVTDALAAFSQGSALNRPRQITLCLAGYMLQQLRFDHEAAQCYANGLHLVPGDEPATAQMASIDLADPAP